MSRRIRRIRKVLNPPTVKGFKPFDKNDKVPAGKSVVLFYDEYEAIRLCDYDLHNHHEASVMMGISRPTFTRIFGSARQKIAKAIIEGLPLTFEGGKVYFDSDWYQCNHCGCDFSNPEKISGITNCPLCGSKNIHRHEDEKEIQISHNNCFCSKCRFEQPHQRGVPCNMQTCPKCGNKMSGRRKRYSIKH